LSMHELLRPLVLRSGAALVLGLSLAACDSEAGGSDEAADGADESEPDPADPCTPGPAPALEIGEGASAYTPFEDGATLELVHGPQGGVHVLLALHAEDIDASVELEGELRGYVNGVQLGASYPFLNMRCKKDEGMEVWNLYLIWDAAPEDLHLQTVHIEAEIVDAQGVMVSASKDAIIHDALLD